MVSSMIVECAYRVLEARYSKRDSITALITFTVSLVTEFDFFTHPIIATIIYIGLKIKILFVYSSDFSAPTTADKNIF